ncbi:hypothetical protein PS467_18915 [Streptomyces luomodiensis]|uniref:DUF1622 domain-containing protein n=1 Tax=Streptomyces luomodiensis TaxID=3026192 RepID=A0ABY9UZ52_9ACTN|nr:hypothetical protein [Streptomyces sp. SCA4-21]WNE97252.1 hypothetical protein PS467_18915 [Streptomyces sp. SCA4-21]
MGISIRARKAGERRPGERDTGTADVDLSEVKPLPVWFFGFEGVMGAAYDLTKAWSDAWMVLVGIGLVNVVVGVTVLRRRMKLMRAMLKNSRTRGIALGLIALRVGLHLLLAVLGAPVTSVAGHLAVAVLMGVTTVTLLWFNQRVTFRALRLA